MKINERNTHYLISAAAVLTGLVCGAYAYLATPAGPHSITSVPYHRAARTAHAVAGIALVFVAGFSWQSHVTQLWKQGARDRRSSGIWIGLALGVSAVSGVLVPIWNASSGPFSVASLTHSASSLLLLVAMLTHRYWRL